MEEGGGTENVIIARTASEVQTECTANSAKRG